MQLDESASRARMWFVCSILLSLYLIVEGEKCSKYSENPRCVLPDKAAQKALTASVEKAIAKGRKYIERKLEAGRELDHVKGRLVYSLAMTSLHLSNGTCSSKIKYQIRKFNYKVLENMSGGQLAMALIGMQASCSFKSKTEQREATLLLKQKMRSFPKGEFNNFFQYSLAVIALHNNGEHISDELGRTLLRNVFLQRKVKIFTDTKPLALIALQAITRQKFNSHWVRKHALVKLNEFEEKIEGKLELETNFIRVLLWTQVFDISKKPICHDVIEKIISRQEKDGSFGRILTTAWAIEALSGHSTLDLKDVKCTVEQIEVKIGNESEETRKANNKQKTIIEVKRIKNPKKINVTVSISYDITGLTHTKEYIATQIQSGSTALDALSNASKSNACFAARTKKTAWGLQILELCNMPQNHGKKMYWMFYVNGEMAKVGASTYKPKHNDAIQFRLQKF